MTGTAGPRLAAPEASPAHVLITGVAGPGTAEELIGYLERAREGTEI